MKNDQKRWQSLLFIVGSIVLSASAQLLMKAGMLELDEIGLKQAISDAFPIMPLLILAFAWVAVGLLLYTISLLFWLAALARYELSLAYPLLSLSYVLVYIGAVMWPRLNETVSFSKTTGILLILGGVFLVTRQNLNSPRNNP